MDNKVNQAGPQSGDVYDQWVEKMRASHEQAQRPPNSAGRLGAVLSIKTYSNYQNFRQHIKDLDQK